MFKVGEIIIGLPDAPYAHTGPGSKCRVLGFIGDNLIVNLTNPPGGRGFEYEVEPQYFAYPDSNEIALSLLNEEE
jgi:hypothetical protein